MKNIHIFLGVTLLYAAYMTVIALHFMESKQVVYVMQPAPIAAPQTQTITGVSSTPLYMPVITDTSSTPLRSPQFAE